MGPFQRLTYEFVSLWETFEKGKKVPLWLAHTRYPFCLSAPGGVHLGKMGTGYVRAIWVPFFIHQKSLKGIQIHKLVSERVPKLQKSKVFLSKGTISRNFDQNLVKINQNLEKIEQNLGKIEQILGKSLSKGPQFIKILSLKGWRRTVFYQIITTSEIPDFIWLMWTLNFWRIGSSFKSYRLQPCELLVIEEFQ